MSDAFQRLSSVPGSSDDSPPRPVVASVVRYPPAGGDEVLEPAPPLEEVPELAAIESLLGDMRRHTSAPPASGPARVCLAMIVRDEATIIERCLACVRPLIDEWLVVDTGSKDATRELVGRALMDLPGELVESTWADFATNRNEALARAEQRGCDYLLVVDADDLVVVAEGFQRPDAQAGADVYDVAIDYGAVAYCRPQLFRGGLGCRYTGRVHEALIVPPTASRAPLEHVRFVVTNDGARSRDPNKFLRDAELLRAEIVETGGDARTYFYLAQSYRDAGARELALAAYEQRAALGGWEEEAFLARLEAAKLRHALGHSDDVVMAAFVRAYEARPGRAEPLCELATALRARKRIVAAYPFARAACDIALPVGESLFVDRAVYEWRSADELGICAYYAGRFGEALVACERALRAPSLPDEHRARILANADFARARAR